jgi:hypothetical protein
VTQLTPEVALSTLVDLLGHVARRHDVAITLTVSPFATESPDVSREPDDVGTDDADDVPEAGSYVPA